jgi:transcriptional regulator with XRE-family HTH domain
MASMNPGNLVKILRLLGISSSDLAQALYVSPSHVSRWKTGSRNLNENNAYYKQMVEYFLSINETQGLQKLEKFLLPDFDSLRGRKTPDVLRSLLEQKLHQFLLQYTQSTVSSPDLQQEEYAVPKSAVQIMVGVENRIEALKEFFEYALTLNPKPDIYIMEVLYASWCPSYLDWFSLCHEYALRYMETGGIIYYFSNLNHVDHATFYSIWQFTSHKNLYPGYSANMAEESPGCAYYLAAGARSVTFYAPEDNIKSYITTVASDSMMLTAQENYLKKKFEQRQQQIFINTMENRNLVVNLTQLHKRKLNPLLFAGKYPNFLFLKSESLKKLLQENQVSDKSVRFCMELHRAFLNQIRDQTVQKTFFYYEEDLLEFAVATEIFDYELTGIIGEPVKLTWEARKELLMNLRATCADASCVIRIASKKNNRVYDALGEAITLWVKRNCWYLIYYPEKENKTDLRMITDPLACTLRYDLYYSTSLNVPNNSIETAGFLSDAIYILDKGMPYSGENTRKEDRQ